ncbi:MAG: flagellar export chaperone FlgN [Syntrophomonadaceae bacterium]|jgi:flagellar biosynthesis/type III secretory pathway chaperone
MESNRLIEFVEDQKQIIQGLIELAEKQFEALQQDNLEQLAIITREQEARLNSLPWLGTDSGSLNHYINQVHLTAGDKNRLDSLLTEMQVSYQQLYELTILNRFVLKNALKHSKDMVNLLEGNPSPIYGRQGKKKAEPLGIMNTVI